MPLLAGPAIDPTIRRPARVWTSSSPLAEPIPPAPAPTFDISAATDAPIVSVVLGRAITRERIGELATAVVDDWVDDVEFLVPGTAGIKASTWDPVWAIAADQAGVSADGHLVYTWDPKGYIVWIEVDGNAVWTGMFRRPIDIGGGVVVMPAIDPSAVTGERILGQAEQPDLLEDRGSFEQYSSIDDMIADGWVFPAGITPTLITTDAVRGTKCLQVTGAGWWRSPRVTVNGADGYGRVIEGASFVNLDDSIDTTVEVLRTRASRMSDAAEDTVFRDAHIASRSDTESGWSDAPITSAARMQPQVTAHRCWVEGKSYPGIDTLYDLVTLRLGITTGAPPGVTRDLSWYFARTFRDLNSAALGGSDTGLRVRATDCGTTATGLRWAHAQRTKVADVLEPIMNRDGAPEARVTPGWWIEVVPRLGTDRTDISITAHDITEPGWTPDPGAQIDDLVVDTGRGNGTSWLSVTVSQPAVANRHRIIALVTGPTDRTLNELELWANAQARAGARLHITKTARVPWWIGMALAAGDTVLVVDHDGLQGIERRMRIVSRRPLPQQLLVELNLGETDA